ncbi:hypothetical protein VTK73DRAFT_6901 [Phialemonium thermophilum]|uniref:Ornithine decarboxylase antizyme n=1 Tax=Phialemonium thermophilum TaxID=223376 RepID=A0ABR3WHW7_9PEZI
MFLGERNAAPYGSILPDVYENTNYNYYHNNKEDDDSSSSYGSHNNNGLYRNGSNGGYARPLGAGSVAPNDRLTPPDDSFLDGPLSMPSKHAYGVGVVSAWLEIWDYAGGSSFRAFVSENEMTKTLFVFFDAGLLGRDLKKALVALIELAEGPLGCSHMVICVDRTMPEDEGKALMKGLQWAGFALTTLDYWTGGVDAVSSRWLFMGMEV